MNNHQKLKTRNNWQFPFKLPGFLCLELSFLIACCGIICPVNAAKPTGVLNVIKSQENAKQWQGITQSLENVGEKYCVIPLANIKSAADLGQQQVLLLPNIETLTPLQAIAIQKWMSQGGNLIASGSVGKLSSLGVRQALRNMLGGYWGFHLNYAQELQPTNNNSQALISQKQLFGKVQGGVMVPENTNTEIVAIWNSSDQPAAVLKTKNSTFLGWHLGTNTDSTIDLDTAWLKTLFNNYLKLSTKPGISPAYKCPVSANQNIRKTSTISNNNSGQFATKSNQVSVNNKFPKKQTHRKISSQKPLSITSLQPDLENLIGRIETAYIKALVDNDHHSNNSLNQEKKQTINSSLEEALTQAREVAKNIPILISQNKYSLARQQWLKTKKNLWKYFPVNQRLAQAEIRSVWLDRETIVNAENEAGLTRIFDRLAKTGINTVFFETVNASYTIYPSQVAPQQNPLIKNWDPLATAVKLAHRRGMELHAWVWTFAAGNRPHNQIIGVNPDYPGPVLADNPDWANYDQSGRMIPIGQTKPFLDPANPGVRKYLLNLYAEIITRYQVDGIQLDYIRYPFQDPFSGRTYGYGQAAREQFKQQTGVDPINIHPHQRNLWKKWTAFRTEQINSFVAEVAQMLRKKEPTLILSVAVFPLPEHERVQKIQQHWEVWAKRGDIDLIVPMTYAINTPQFQKLTQPWINSQKLGSTLLVPGIRLLSLPTFAAFDQIQVLRDLPVSGYALFAVDNFNNELDQLLSNTQGKRQGLQIEPIPQRQPFRTAAFRYAALQKEWQFLKNNQKFHKSMNTMADFQNYSQKLQNALNQLAALPSAGYLISAKAELARFQTRFKIWMSTAAKENPYRVKVWENRLLMIERLLRFGEMKVINRTKNR